MNHSQAGCNVFLQPVFADGHHDAAMPSVAFFASRRIEAFTELQWDYGPNYGGCSGGVQQPWWLSAAD